MSVDLSMLSIEALETVIVDAQRLIKEKKKTQFKVARSQAEKLAAELGFTLEELVAGKATDSAETTKIRKAVEVRYRNPDNHQETWTGRGKQPRWLAAAIASGCKLEEFAV